MGQGATLALVGGIFGFVILLLILAVYFSPARRLKRELRAMPLRRIAEISDGAPSRIAGAATVLQEQLVSPFGAKPCVYYVATVERRVKSGKNHHWRMVCKEVRAVHFLVDDGSGRVLVDPAAAKVALATDSVSRSGTFDDPNEQERAFLARAGANPTGLMGFNKSLRYTEQSIAVGEKISVRGHAAREGDALRMAGTPQSPVLITDDVALAKAS